MREIPNNIKSLLKEIKDSFSKQLGKNLIGIYIHGSLAMGSFNINSSDVDFLVIRKLLSSERQLKYRLESQQNYMQNHRILFYEKL